MGVKERVREMSESEGGRERLKERILNFHPSTSNSTQLTFSLGTNW